MKCILLRTKEVLEILYLCNAIAGFLYILQPSPLIVGGNTKIAKMISRAGEGFYLSNPTPIYIVG
jgi:hypothetical protein